MTTSIATVSALAAITLFMIASLVTVSPSQPAQTFANHAFAAQTVEARA